MIVWAIFLCHITTTVQLSNGISESKFLCTSGATLNFSKVCDGYPDCKDNSDETMELCNSIVCPEKKYRCFYGACIDRSAKCNGIKNCADGSDESQCGRNPELQSCPVTHFRCKAGRCIPANQICNKVKDCRDGSDENELMCNHGLCPDNTFRCTFGWCIFPSAQCDGFIDCLDRSDEHPSLCNNSTFPLNRCPSIKKTRRIQASCELNFKKVSCQEPIKPGTTVTYSCSPFYLPATEKHRQNLYSYCQKNGVWSRDILNCVPVCGKFEPVVPLIIHGWHPKYKFPWHVTVLKKVRNWRIICGATLISEYLVLTAAHCVWNTVSKNLRIGFGNMSQATRKFPLSKMIKKIFIHPLYLDYEGHYTADIALIVLHNPVRFSRRILPICIDWEQTDQSSNLPNATIGYIMGLGKTHQNVMSRKINVVAVPVVSNTQCIANVREDFKRHITPTSFCGGWRNGSSVCNGDSGGGLAFLMNDKRRFVIQGIVSLSPLADSSIEIVCDPFSYVVFTKIRLFINWIAFYLNKVNNARGL